MNKLLNDLDSGIEVKTEYGVYYAYSPEIVEKFRQTLQRLEAIENANPSEAMKALKELRVIANTYCSFNGTQCEHNKELADIIEKALLKAQEDEKLKVDICEMFGLDNLFPYNDTKPILKELEEYMDRRNQLWVDFMKTSKELKELLKVQETKKYLTWEDLDFKEETTYENVKMGEHIYELKYWKYKDSYKDFMGNDIYYYEKFVFLRGHQIECTELFNDLHLERVEK